LKPRVPKTLRKTLLTVVILIMVFLGAGAAYVYFADRPAKPVTTLQVPNPDAEPGLFKPSVPRPNSTESAAIEALDTPVKAGNNTSVTVKTLPTSSCTIVVAYNDVASKDSGLVAKTADAYGSVTWSWTVEPAAAVGIWPVKITCGFNGRTAFVQGDLQVTN